MHAVAVGWYWSIVQILDIEKSRSWREAKIHTEDAHPRNSKCLRFFDQYTNISMETVARKTCLTGCSMHCDITTITFPRNNSSELSWSEHHIEGTLI